jgi:hypothetical protein
MSIVRPRRIRAPRLVLLAGAAAAFAPHASRPAAAQDAYSTGWQFAVTPYAWLAGIEGRTRVSGLEGNLDTKSGSFLESLDFAGMLTIEARRGEWALLADFVYLDLSTDRTSPGPLGSAATIELKGTVVSAGISRTILGEESFSLDALAGLRYIGIRDEIGLQVGGLTRSVSETRDWVDPIIGVRGRIDLGTHWFLPYYVDVGGFGLASDLTWQAAGGVGYRFGFGDARLGYRYLSYDFEDGSFVYDIDVAGPTLGVTFRF